MKTKILYSNYHLKGWSFLNSMNFTTKKTSDSDLIIFFQSICEFFNVYDNIVLCLEASLHSISTNQEIFHSMINAVKKGSSLSLAMEKSKLFHKTIINIVQAGEYNNDLLGSFQLILEFLKSKQEQRGRFFKSLFYPLFTFGVFFLTVILFSRYIVPSLVELIVELNGSNNSLRFMTTSLFVLEKFLLFVFFVLFSFGGIYFYQYDLFEKICIQLPFLSSFIINSNLYLFAYYIHISLKNSLSIEEAFDVGIGSSNQVFKAIFQDIKENIVKGYELSHCLKKSKFIPKIFVDIIGTGEKTNNLANSFLISSKFFRQQYNQAFDSLMNLLPIILIVLVAALLIILIGFLLFPLYSLGF